MTTESDDRVAADERTLTLSVPSMDCPSCVRKIEGNIRHESGILAVDAMVTSGRLVVKYDPTRTDEPSIRHRIEAVGYAVEGSDSATITVEVPSMDCSSCASKIERSLAARDGVISVETRPAAGRVEVHYESNRIDSRAVVAAIEGAGYAVLSDEHDEPVPVQHVWRSRRAIATGIGAVLLLAGLVFQFVLPGLNAPVVDLLGRIYHVSHLLYITSAIIAGAPILRNGYYSARARSLDIDFLMSAGIIGAVGAHHPFEGAALAVLFSVAQLLERAAMDRTRSSLRELMELAPSTASVRRDGNERTVPVESIRVGETVLVRPGERIPVDGRVRAGQSAVDQAPITGESVPVDKEHNDEVFAGTINQSGYLEIEVTSPADDSTLAQIIAAVGDAEAARTKREQFVDRFAAVYTPIVVAAAIVTAVGPPLLVGASWDTWFLRGLTLLVIACPCAFVISTPVSVVSGITSAARNGVLIKGGTHLEAMGEVDVVAIDKTGTLTTGDLSVTQVIPLNGNDEAAVMRCASALEQRSEHPIGRAIVEYASDLGVADRSVENFEALPGQGVRATLDGVDHYAGKPALFAELGFDLEHTHRWTDGGSVTATVPESCPADDCLDLVAETIPDLERAGSTIVLVGTAEELEGIIAIADTIRPEAAVAVERLYDLGIEAVVMLTGDNEGTARAIAAQVGIDRYEAELLPDEKLNAIRQLESEIGPVAMVGDGVNDAPALAIAHVGIAMGAAGTDTALETADVALMTDDLTRLAYLVRLSRAANRVIRQNIWSSLGVKAILAVGAPFGLVTVIHAVLIGDMGMSLTVTGNALRLGRVDPVEVDT